MENAKQAISEKMALLLVSALIAIVAFAIISPLVSFVAAYTPTNTVNGITADLQVPGTCAPQVDNLLVTFPSTFAGSFAPTDNAVNVVDLGNTGSNIFVYGVNWISTTSTASFLVGNTLWSATKSTTSAIGTNLGSIISFPAGQDTQIPVLQNGGGNAIFFGLNVPAGQTPTTYNQLITVALSC